MLTSENNPKILRGDFGDSQPELYIEQEDFMEDPPKNFFRLAPCRMVRLKSAYIIRCDEVVRDAAGQITELRCSYIPKITADMILPAST